MTCWPDLNAHVNYAQGLIEHIEQEACRPPHSSPPVLESTAFLSGRYHFQIDSGEQNLSRLNIVLVKWPFTNLNSRAEFNLQFTFNSNYSGSGDSWQLTLE